MLISTTLYDRLPRRYGDAVTTSLQDLGLLVKRLQMQHHRRINADLAPLGISLVQWDALRHLHRHPDASLHDLAVLTFQTDQAFGTLASRMITRRLIERVAGPGRAVRHRLTGKGSELLTSAASVVDAALTDSLGALTANERETLAALLQRVVREPAT